MKERNIAIRILFITYVYLYIKNLIYVNIINIIL